MPTLTAAQLALLRSSPHTSNWYCVPIVPELVWVGQVTGSPGEVRVGLTAVPYATNVGYIAEIKQGMTLWISSGGPAPDVGITRIRKAPDANNIYVAWNSDIAWKTGDYLYVYKQYLPWGISQRIVGTTIYKDYDILYTDQTINWPPVAMMGDNVCKLWDGLGAAGGTNVYFDGSESYGVGAIISSYLWDFDDPYSASNSSTAMTPGDHEYATPGTHYPTLTVTDSNGKTHMTRRIVSLPQETPYTVNFEQTELSAAIDDGWKAKVRAFDPNMNPANFPDRAPCFIISKDTFGGTEGSVGFPRDREQVVMFGYIVEDSVAVQPEYNEITFEINSIAGVMQKIEAQPVAVNAWDTPNSKPEPWAWGVGLTIFKSLIYLLKFHSTVMDIADVKIYNDVTPIKNSGFPADNLWNMLLQFAKSARLMHAGSTRTGRIIVDRDPNITPDYYRSAVPVVCQLDDGDWRDQVTIPQKPFPSTAFLCASGLMWSGNQAHEFQPAYGMSPGRPPKSYGVQKEVQFLEVKSQSEINEFAGLLVGTDNMPYGDIVIPIRGNWTKAFDPAWQEYVQAPAGGFATKRGTLLFGDKLIVRKVSVKFDWAAGLMQPTLTCDYYSVTEVAVNGDCWPPDAPIPPPRITPVIVPPPKPPLNQPAPVIASAVNACASGTSRTTLTITYGGTGSPTYYIYRSTSATSGFALIGTTLSTTYVDSTVIPGVRYYYKVVGNIGTGFTPYSVVVSAMTSFCTPALSISLQNCVTSHLTWTAVSGAVSYQVERSTTSGSGFVNIATVSAAILTYDDTPTTRGIYYYRVRAQNAYASSSYSNEVSGPCGYDIWHPNVVLATSSHVYQFSGATFGIGYFPTPTDITGNITGTILGVRLYGGDLYALTTTYIWKHTTGSSWSPSTSADLWAAGSSLWTHSWWNEDGTGIHGHAVWGNRSFEHPSAFPCDQPHTGDSLNPYIHWTYVATVSYLQLIGDVVTVDSRTGTILEDCSLKHNGVWATTLNAGEPDTFGLLSDTTQPNVWDQGLGAVLSTGNSAHFSPYATEVLHDFNLQNNLMGSSIFYDNADISDGTFNLCPYHYTDEQGHVWMWGGNGTNNHLRRDDGLGMVEVLAQDAPTYPMSLSCPPSATTIRVLAGGAMYISVNGGSTWSSEPSFTDAVGLYVNENEQNRIYGLSRTFVGGLLYQVGLWLSNDNGATWCNVWNSSSEDGVTPLGIWADTTS